MIDAEAAQQFVDDIEIGAGFAGGLDEPGPEQHAGVAAAAIIVVVLEEHGGGQHDIGHFGRIGHELLVDDGEEVIAGEAGAGEPLLRADVHRVGVLDEQRLDRAAAFQGFGVAGEDLADLAHIEFARVALFERGALDQRLVELPGTRIGVESAATTMAPGARHGRDGERRMHGRRAVALAGKAVAEAEIGFRRGADEMGEGLDLGDAEAGDGGGPFGRAGLEVRLEGGGEIGVARHIVTVGEVITQQDVHDGDGQCAIGAGAEHQRHIGLLHGAVAVDIDGDDLGAALLAGADGVGHDVDLGGDGIGAPDDDAIALGHLLGIGAGEPAGAGDEAGPGGAGADGVVLQRIAARQAQPLDAVAMHMAHGAGVEIGPDRLRPVLGLDGEEFCDDLVEGLIPTDRLEFA